MKLDSLSSIINILTNILQRRLQLNFVGKWSFFRKDDKPKRKREEVGCNQEFRVLQIHMQSCH